MARHRPLRVRVVAGEDLSPAEIDAMYALRASLFAIKTDRRAADRAGFAARVRLGQRNLLFEERDGRLRGIFSMHWQPAPDGSALWLLPEYGFMDREVRGHPVFPRAIAREVARLLLRARGRPLWFAGIGYPRSFRTMARVSSRHWTLADAGAPDAARAILLHLHETFAGERWDRERHHVDLATIPERRPPGDVGAAWRRFEEIVPHWERGYGLGIAVQFTWAGLLLDGPREVFVRTWRGAAPASGAPPLAQTSP